MTAEFHESGLPLVIIGKSETIHVELPLEEALKVAVEVASALDKANRQGVQHRDLKPGNIILSRTRFVTSHASDMLAARIQAIDGTGTLAPQDSQPCRLLPSVYASRSTS